MRSRPSLRAALLAMALVATPAGHPVSAAAVPAAAEPVSRPGPVAATSRLVPIPAGRYAPLYKRPQRDAVSGEVTRAAAPVEVAPFRMATHAVTNAEYLAFVLAHPEWRRSRASRLYVDEGYLQHWRGDTQLGEDAPPASPVVNVSWFAARAYCAAHGRRLPTVDQWEYVAAASEHHADGTHDAAYQRRLRNWYAQPTPRRVGAVGSTFRNVYGIWDLHGLVWEWTDDFSSALVNGESRGDAALDRSLFCGSGAANAADFRDYAGFMRFAFRSSLSARYCVGNLGFREAAPAAARTPHDPRGRT